jgi:hypothetical protein
VSPPLITEAAWLASQNRSRYRHWLQSRAIALAFHRYAVLPNTALNLVASFIGGIRPSHPTLLQRSRLSLPARPCEPRTALRPRGKRWSSACDRPSGSRGRDSFPACAGSAQPPPDQPIQPFEGRVMGVFEVVQPASQNRGQTGHAPFEAAAPGPLRLGPDLVLELVQAILADMTPFPRKAVAKEADPPPSSRVSAIWVLSGCRLRPFSTAYARMSARAASSLRSRRLDRIQLLSTPHRSGAVTFNFAGCDRLRR